MYIRPWIAILVSYNIIVVYGWGGHRNKHHHMSSWMSKQNALLATAFWLAHRSWTFSTLQVLIVCMHIYSRFYVTIIPTAILLPSWFIPDTEYYTRYRVRRIPLRRHRSEHEVVTQKWARRIPIGLLSEPQDSFQRLCTKGTLCGRLYYSRIYMYICAINTTALLSLLCCSREKNSLIKPAGYS